MIVLDGKSTPKDTEAISDVSVVMCTYNGARHLSDQLESIARQTLLPAELIVGDDGSSDATVDVVRDFASRAPFPVRMRTNHERLGFADNFLSTTALASSPFIAFSDQDDLWYPDKLRRSRALMEDPTVNLVVHPVDVIDAEGASLGRPRRRPHRRRRGDFRLIEPHTTSLDANFLGFTMTVRAEAMDRWPPAVRGLDPHDKGAPLSHDRWILFAAGTQGRTAVIQDCLAAYRQHGTQLYGGEVKQGRSIRTRLTAQTERGVELNNYRADLAESRSRLFSSMAGFRWKVMADHYRARSELFRTQSVTARLGKIVTGVLRGRYSTPFDGGLGTAALYQDVAFMAATVFTGLHSAIKRSVFGERSCDG